MSRELQEIIEKEELVRDAMRLQQYRCEDRTVRLIDRIRKELADETNDMGEIYYIYKFAERLKEELDKGE